VAAWSRLVDSAAWTRRIRDPGSTDDRVMLECARVPEAWLTSTSCTVQRVICQRYHIRRNQLVRLAPRLPPYARPTRQGEKRPPQTDCSVCRHLLARKSEAESAAPQRRWPHRCAFAYVLALPGRSSLVPTAALGPERKHTTNSGQSTDVRVHRSTGLVDRRWIARGGRTRRRIRPGRYPPHVIDDVRRIVYRAAR